MNSSNVHAVLGDLYRLLGDHSPSDLIAASEYLGITPNVREALRALAREASRREVTYSPNIAAERFPRRAEPAAGTATGLPGIVESIKRSRRFYSNASLLDFCKSVGLRVSPRPKESAERLIRRVAKAIHAIPDSRRSQIMAMIGPSTDDQTQGWMDVITGSRP